MGSSAPRCITATYLCCPTRVMGCRCNKDAGHEGKHETDHAYRWATEE